MNKRNELHAKRLRECLNQITQFESGETIATSPEFQTWQERAEQSLKELFGKDHDYTRRFNRLRFWETRVSIGSFSWTGDDQDTMHNDLSIAKQILSDALEEIELVPTVDHPTPERKSQHSTSSVVVNVTNILSQTVEVQMSQLLTNLSNMGLSPSDLAAAEQHANELANETRGQQRWPVLSKSLDALKVLGKAVYENVAIPLLLEMLKKQAGL